MIMLCVILGHNILPTGSEMRVFEGEEFCYRGMKSYRFHDQSFKQDLFATSSPIETHKTYTNIVTSQGINLYFCDLKNLLLILHMRRQLITLPTKLTI